MIGISAFESSSDFFQQYRNIKKYIKSIIVFLNKWSEQKTSNKQNVGILSDSRSKII